MRRFYEVVVLLLALNEAYRSAASKKSNDLSYNAGEDSDEQLFHNFVVRLGQICNSRPSGSTVTAFVVLQHPDKIEYVFASNRRTIVELETTKAYISAVLASLRDSSSCEDDDQREELLSHLLRDVLMYNRERIKCYLNGLTNDFEACIAICGTEGSPTGESNPYFYLNLFLTSLSSLAVSRQETFAQMLKLVRLANLKDNDDDECKLH
jgi:hypothetical protein